MELRKTEPVLAKKGLNELLSYLTEKGIPCAVATSTRRDSAQQTLQRIHAMKHLKTVVYGDSVEHGKPEPDIFLKAGKELGIEPEHLLVIEDSANGILAANRAGMPVLHIPDTLMLPEEILSLTNVICEDLTYVISVLEAWNKGAKEHLAIQGNPKVDLVMVDRMRVLSEFAKYTDHYNSSDPKIKLKIDHTYRVAGLCERIALAEGVLAYDRELLWLCGMLHDIGRFEQVHRYGTFQDADSIDHAQFGADLLFHEGLMEQFLPEKMAREKAVREKAAKEKTAEEETAKEKTAEKQTTKEKIVEEKSAELQLIELAIRSHSAYRIPDNLSERERMFCNILRDADKVDILKVNVETGAEKIYDVTTEELRNTEITPEVFEAFLQRKAIPRALKRTAVDHILGHISLTFELVYGESVRLVKKQGYLDRLLSFDSLNPKTREMFGKIREVMSEVIG